MIKGKKHLMEINGGQIAATSVDGQDYICLTHMVKNFEGSHSLIGHWMTTKSTIEFLGLWEQMYNPNFKLPEFREFRNSAGSNNFSLSAQRWIEVTGAVGIISKSGKYGGTYAHKDLAFEFASWLSPEFKLYLIKEFQRMKEDEQKGLAWDVRRLLSKVNYKLHTSAVRDVLIPIAKIAKEKEGMVYADEAEMFNLVVFGMTSRQWREKHPKEALRDENIRDHANILQLTVLSNLESLNSMMIREGTSKADRYTKLKRVAREQLQNLVSSTKQLEEMDADAAKQAQDSPTLNALKAGIRNGGRVPPPGPL